MVSLIDSIETDEDRAFMENLYLKFHPMMVYTVRRYCQDPHDVEDIISVVSIALIRHLDRLKTIPSNGLPYYIFQTVKNTTLNQCLKMGRYNQHFLLYGDIANRVKDEDDFTYRFLMQDQLQTVLDTLRKLPVKEHLALRMRLIEKKSEEEIAEAAELSVTSVRKYIERARKHLRELIKKEEEEEDDD